MRTIGVSYHSSHRKKLIHFWSLLNTQCSKVKKMMIQTTTECGHKNETCLKCCSHPVVLKQLQDEGNGAAVDADEQVDAGQRHIGCARHVKDVGHGIHHGCHWPPTKTKKSMCQSFIFRFIMHRPPLRGHYSLPLVTLSNKWVFFSASKTS